MNFFIGIFQGFWLQISPGKFQNSYLQEHFIFPEHLHGYS